MLESFGRADLVVADRKSELLAEVEKRIARSDKPVFLLLMSSGTFDGIDWNGVSSQQK